MAPNKRVGTELTVDLIVELLFQMVELGEFDVQLGVDVGQDLVEDLLVEILLFLLGLVLDVLGFGDDEFELGLDGLELVLVLVLGVLRLIKLHLSTSGWSCCSSSRPGPD